MEKTKEEIRAQKLRECDQQITEMEALWREGWTVERLTQSLEMSRVQLDESKNVERYVPVAGRMVRSTDEMSALRAAAETMERLVKIGKCDPEQELKNLLRTKIRLLQETLDES